MQISKIQGQYDCKNIKIQKAANVQNRYLVSKPFLDTVSFAKREEFEIGISLKELKARLKPDVFEEKKMLDVTSEQYLKLAQGDKKALAHLTNAAEILDNVFLKQNNELNIPFREFLTRKAEAGDKKAKMALQIFNGQKGIMASDREANKVILLKGAKKTAGAGFYPTDLTTEEFHTTLQKMIEDGQTEEVKKILNQRSVIKRDGGKLKAIDFTQAYQKEFTMAADELDKAAMTSTNKDFNEFLRLQAKALRENNPMADALADKKWATLQETPLEFTITREGYAETMTGSVTDNPTLAKILEEKGIAQFTKDSIGARVGIVNKEGTQELLSMKKYLPIIAQNMPFNDKYEQNISTDLSAEIKQAMVDVDLVTMTGDAGAYRAGITIAENLPNDDKMSLAIGGGRRNVYHRQIRMSANPQQKAEQAKKLLAVNLHQYFNELADHWFVELHENTHSCGPKIIESKLGTELDGIIEENKADMGGLSSLNDLVKAGKYSEKEKREILTTFVAKEFNAVKRKPGMDKPHRVRSVMQLNYLMKEGGITIEKKGLFVKKGVINLDFDKMMSGCKKMLEEIITIQLENNKEKAEKYVTKNFVWSKDIELVAKQVRKTNKVLNGYVNAPLAKQLLKSLK